MSISQSQNEIANFIDQFDEEFFSFIADYEALFGAQLALDDKIVIEEYIQNVKNVIENFDY